MQDAKSGGSAGRRILQSPMGTVLARPWLDRVLLLFLKYLFFPLSRLWGAARKADGSLEAFVKATPLERPGRQRIWWLGRVLQRFEKSRLKAFSTEQLWELYFFGAESVAAERLPVVEEMRLDNRTSYNTVRLRFVPLAPLVKASVYVDPPTPEVVAERYGAEGEGVEALFVPTRNFPTVERSRPLSLAHGSDYWLRFTSPSAEMDDHVYARVHEPEGVVNPPTLIFGHGICVEFDHYRQLLDEITALTDLGIRVIRPEAPWHGRRVLPGHYGGEQLLSALPTSMIEFLAAQHREWATLIHWCRQDSSGAVAVGGSSLGAQTAKAIAMRASNWPKPLQPDALLCITHCTHIAEAALDGELSDIWNLGMTMREQGWSRELERKWLEKLDPQAPPCMSGDRIVSVTGSRDTVTPESSALQHLRTWQVPSENIFSYPRGHFTVPLGLISDNAPLKRFSEILQNVQPAVDGGAA